MVGRSDGSNGLHRTVLYWDIGHLKVSFQTARIHVAIVCAPGNDQNSRDYGARYCSASFHKSAAETFPTKGLFSNGGRTRKGPGKIAAPVTRNPNDECRMKKETNDELL